MTLSPQAEDAAANPTRYTFSTNFVLVRRSSLERRRKLCAEAGGLGFVTMHDGVFKQRT